MSFRLLNYVAASGKAPRAGLLIGEFVVDLEACIDKSAASGIDPTSTLSVLQSWDKALPLLEKVAKAPVKNGKPLKDTTLAAPILYPSNIFCAAANYQDHFREMSGKDVDKSAIKPYFFAKLTRQTVIGPGQQIRRPPFVQKMDWEAEIGVVIGRAARNVPAARAMEYVAGYTIVNDLSARDFIKRADWPFLSSDWLWQKSFETSAPMGPWITPKSAIADVHNLKINTIVNGQLEQDTHSKWMVFNVPEQIEALSQHFTLQPGDVIATGTGGGVGHPKGRYLTPGSICRIEVEGLGVLENPVVQGE